jgi:hypothetical protein
MRQRVQRTFDHAAATLGLAGTEEVISLVETLAEELSYIEALREGLLRRVQAMTPKLERYGRAWRGDTRRGLTQVQRLHAIAVRRIGKRFDEVDAMTGEVLSALRNIDSQQVFIRSRRDGLYRSQRAWEPLLDEWDHAGPALDAAVWALLARTYPFLAPRYMPVTEWVSSTALRPLRGTRRLQTAMSW